MFFLVSLVSLRAKTPSSRRGTFLGNEDSARSFLVDVRARCLRHNAFFFQDLGRLTKVFGRVSAAVAPSTG